MAKTILSGFNGYPKYACSLLRPERFQDFVPPNRSSCIARGQGSSYSDAAINTKGFVISTHRLNRFLAFDCENGVLTVEAGVTLHEICQVVVPAGWFLPVMPGTAFVSVGGAVAADVHGKNHLYAGSFSRHLIWFELILAGGNPGGNRMRCSETENSEIFWATVGGMGLTGLITTICLRLKPIVTSLMEVQTTVTTGLEALLSAFKMQTSFEYTVAWFDPAKEQRGVLTAARHAKQPMRTKEKKGQSFNLISFPLPFSVISPFSVRAFNHAYFALQQWRSHLHYVSYLEYFYPLDRLKHWPFLYGRKGFIQYQCVFPWAKALSGIQSLFALLQREKIVCSLVVLKQLGVENKSPLSFAREGVTLAIDMPFSEHLLSVLGQADEAVLSYNGRVYLAKDVCLSKAMVKKMYPHYSQWMSIKQMIDPHFQFQSALSARLFS